MVLHKPLSLWSKTKYMNNILNLRKSDWDYRIDIEFNVRDGKLISSKSEGNESPILLEVIFLYFKNEISIPLCYMEGDVTISLTECDDGSDDTILDVYFYRDWIIDEVLTPRFVIDEGLMSDIKSTLILKGIEDHINSIEYRDSLKDYFKNMGLEIVFDENISTIKIDNNDINKHISWI